MAWDGMSAFVRAQKPMTPARSCCAPAREIESIDRFVI